MKLILIRHGESARNRGYEVLDEENNLTAVGVKQAIEVGEDLVGQKIEAIYSSPTPRCVQTLDEILRLRKDNMPIHLTLLLGPKMKSESYDKLKSRVTLFLDDLKYDHQDKESVVIISHQRVLAMLILLATGEPKKMANGEMVGIEVENEKRQ
jgi:broad specificity phosphatase PhoE